MGNYANLDSREGSVTAETTLTFDKWRPKRYVINNDSVSLQLKVKFNSSETYMSLNPTESLSIDVNSRTVIIQSEDGVTSVDYRIWGIG